MGEVCLDRQTVVLRLEHLGPACEQADHVLAEGKLLGCLPGVIGDGDVHPGEQRQQELLTHVRVGPVVEHDRPHTGEPGVAHDDLALVFRVEQVLERLDVVRVYEVGVVGDVRLRCVGREGEQVLLRVGVQPVEPAVDPGVEVQHLGVEQQRLHGAERVRR